MHIPILSYFKPAQFEPLAPRDILLFLIANGIAIFGLVTPFTPGWRILRAAVCAPLTSVGLIYWAYYTTFDSYMDQCGSITICAYYTITAFRYLVLFPAEEYCFRVRPRPSIKLTLSPKSDAALNGAGKSESSGMEMEAEPIPPAWSWAKLGWAASLWWSWRGIGWNFAAPLPPAASEEPFLRSSTRTKWLTNRLVHYTVMMLVYDGFRAYMNCDSAARLFFTHHTPSYSGLTQWQRAIYSTAAAFRLFLNMQKTYVPTSIVFVGLGGLLGWESEYFAPWGWPPLFAGLADVWKYPGLSVAWSRLWHQFFRAWLYLFGWVGIGENILGLSRSGPDPRYPLAAKPSSAVTPALGPSPQTSGRTSPTHPLPPAPSKRSGLALTNLIKSLCAFALTGLIHDYGYYFTLFHLYAKKPSFWDTWHWTSTISSTKFFVCQPFGIALEAGVKKAWRGWKRRTHPGWQLEEPTWLVFTERLVGFVWTWTFLGWTAGWYVDGVARDGYYRRDETQKLFPSLMGGLMYGKWHH